MGIYRNICYKVEDAFVKFLTKGKDPEEIRKKVEAYRKEKEQERLRKKEEAEKRIAEQKRLQEEKKEIERQEVLALLSQVVDVDNKGYTQYEFNEVKNNKNFFQSLIQRVFEQNEKGLTFIYCEFDKSSKKEIKGYLIATNKRVLFVNKSLTFMDKFRYQTIINVNWFADGILERGLLIQYGKRRLEFDEMYDSEQMKRLGNVILNMASNK
ncbi:PH domain-containing protein [Peribacillus tepidiphilus]|uniref:PH domain-containing protein n=1 Tax=Peribacillus tepidiphilus TaxID=2652445 RepID=UPI001291F858|nr:PH domain-containing protein [Peribacillus tepidiphilus]